MRREAFPTFRRIGRAAAAPWRDWPGTRDRIAFGLRRILILALIVFVICAIPWTYFNIKYTREVERELARLRDAGEPLTIEEMIPEPVPDNQNAAVIYQEVFDVSFGKPAPEPPSPSSPRVEEAPEEPKAVFGVIPSVEYYRALDSLGYGETFEVEVARELLSQPDVVEVLAKLAEASMRPYSVWPIRWEDGFAALFPHMPTHRQAARLLSIRVALSVADGDTDDALRWIGVSLRMSRQATTEPTLIAQLVAFAVQAMAVRDAEVALDAGMPSPEAAAELHDLAASVDMTSSFHRALQLERAYGLYAFDFIQREDAETVGALFGGNVPAAIVGTWQGPLGAPLRAFDQARMLANWRVMLPNLDQPCRLQAPDATERALKVDSKLAILTQMMLPVLSRITQKRDQTIARLDELGIVLDLKMHKREHGSYPATLDDLGGELPADPFSGEAYRYERRGEGFILWSIGQDLEDDGGIPPKPRSDLDWGEADIVWECAG